MILENTYPDKKLLPGTHISILIQPIISPKINPKIPKKMKARIAESVAGGTKNELFIKPQTKKTSPPSTPINNPENIAYPNLPSFKLYTLNF
ncbi:MAG: hypothetical protein FJ150_09075 [Euryarchaeota archaeon]|nr:hypothetical protein [Euryarchaeota archaeon]